MKTLDFSISLALPHDEVRPMLARGTRLPAHAETFCVFPEVCRAEAGLYVKIPLLRCPAGSEDYAERLGQLILPVNSSEGDSLSEKVFKVIVDIEPTGMVTMTAAFSTPSEKYKARFAISSDPEPDPALSGRLGENQTPHWVTAPTGQTDDRAGRSVPEEVQRAAVAKTPERVAAAGPELPHRTLSSPGRHTCPRCNTGWPTSYCPECACSILDTPSSPVGVAPALDSGGSATAFHSESAGETSRSATPRHSPTLRDPSAAPRWLLVMALLVLSLVMGMIVGAVAYTEGIVKADPYALGSWLTLPILIPIALLACGRHFPAVLRFVTLGSPYLVIAGAWLVYRHPDFLLGGLPWATLSTVLAFSLFRFTSSRPLLARILKRTRGHAPMILFYCILICDGILADSLVRPRYLNEAPVALRYKGQGFLNLQGTDSAVAFNRDGQLMMYFHDQFDFEIGNLLDSRHWTNVPPDERSRLRGPLFLCVNIRQETPIDKLQRQRRQR